MRLIVTAYFKAINDGCIAERMIGAEKQELLQKIMKQIPKSHTSAVKGGYAQQAESTNI